MKVFQAIQEAMLALWWWQLIQGVTMLYLLYRVSMLKRKLRSVMHAQLGVMGALGYQIAKDWMRENPPTMKEIPPPN